MFCLSVLFHAWNYETCYIADVRNEQRLEVPKVEAEGSSDYSDDFDESSNSEVEEGK